MYIMPTNDSNWMSLASLKLKMKIIPLKYSKIDGIEQKERNLQSN